MMSKMKPEMAVRLDVHVVFATKKSYKILRKIGSYMSIDVRIFIIVGVKIMINKKTDVNGGSYSSTEGEFQISTHFNCNINDFNIDRLKPMSVVNTINRSMMPPPGTPGTGGQGSIHKTNLSKPIIYRYYNTKGED